MSIVYSSLNHPLRVPLAAEVHSRPHLRLSGAESVTHLAVYARDGSEAGNAHMESQHATLAALCAHFGVTAPGTDAKYFYHDFGRLRLKWECHTEFATYTFALQQESQLSLAEAFARAPIAHVPEQWLLGLQGRIMVAAHVVLEAEAAPLDAGDPSLREAFEGSALAGSRVLQGAEVWTDFLIQADGFSRFAVRDVGMREQQSGRLVQRVLEIETYRMMALLGLPHAQRALPMLNTVETELARLTAAMVDADETRGGDGATRAGEEQELLRDITGLAARVEKLSLENSYRFSASQAYFRLVRARIEELREVRIEGVPTLEEFMDRRLAPAMSTCESVARRQEALAERIAHTNDLLRTRVGIVQEQQNWKILQSLNTRAAQQLRLQQAVEGLSVVAISYYLASLFHYAAGAAEAAGVPVHPEIATGLVIPLIAGAVWYGLQRVHRSMHAVRH